MSLDANFNNLLNEYLSVELLSNELVKQDFMMSKVTMDNKAHGGNVIVPFEGQYASSIAFGSLTDDTDIADYKYVRGSLAPTVELTGTIKFLDKDLRQHAGARITEDSFLKILPGQIQGFVSQMKCSASVNMLNGSHFATLTVSGTAGGVIEVDRPERFTKDMKVALQDGNTAAANYYVTNVDINGGTLEKGAVTLSATRGGAAADVSAYTVGQSARAYHPGAASSSFTSVKSQLLSLANSGPATLFGVTKTDWTHLQATQVSGAGVSVTNILSKIFGAVARTQAIARGGAKEVIMSLNNFGAILALLEVGGGASPGAPAKGAFSVVPGSTKVSPYGWREVMIGSPNGDTISLTGVLDMDNDWMWINGGWDTVTFYSNGGLQRLQSPEGIQYFTKRSTSGLVYIADHVLQGDLAITAPYKHGIIHSIPQLSL